MSIRYDIKQGIVRELKKVSKSSGYESAVVTAMTTEKNPSDIVEYETPLVCVLDAEQETEQVSANNQRLYTWNLRFTCWVKPNSAADVDQALEKLIDSVSEWVRNVAVADIHDNVLAIRLAKPNIQGLTHEDKLGGAHLMVILTYYEGTSADSTGSVYGDDTLGSTKEYLTDLLTDLMTAMSGSTDPHFEAVVPQHNAVIPNLNAVSVDLDPYESEPSGLDTGVMTKYRLVYSVRIHTNYIGGTIDALTNIRLMDSVKTYLNTHKDLDVDSNCYIDFVRGGSDRVEFIESYTSGGELYVEILKTVCHIQG